MAGELGPEGTSSGPVLTGPEKVELLLLEVVIWRSEAGAWRVPRRLGSVESAARNELLSKGMRLLLARDTLLRGSGVTLPSASRG